MNIEFIKWLIGYAEGYYLKTVKYKGQVYEYVDYGEDRMTLKDFVLCNPMALSLLLQRAIEGINEKGVIEITAYKDRLFINDIEETWGRPYYFRDYDSMDQTKEEALKYIWEQEK